MEPQTPNFLHTPPEANPPSKRRWEIIRFILKAKLIAIGTFLLIASLPTATYLAHANLYENKIFPRVKIGTIDVTSYSQSEAERLIERLTQQTIDQGLRFHINKHEYLIQPSVIRDQKLVTYEIKNTVRDAYMIGRKGGILQMAGERLNVWILGRKLPLPMKLDREALEVLLKKEFAEETIEARDAGVKVHFKDDGSVSEINLLAEREGFLPNFARAIDETESALKTLDEVDLTIKVTQITAGITASEATDALPDLNAMLVSSGVTIFHQAERWSLNRVDVADSLGFERDENGEVSGVIVPAKLSSVTKRIHKAVDVPPTNAVFEMEDGKVTKFAIHEDGLGVDEEKLAADLRDALFQRAASIELPMKPIEPKKTLEKINNFGLKELLGTGRSKFKGSPRNRIKNIANGAKRLRYSLIEPGQEFSLLEKLRPFDETGGYLPELVIKGSKIEPEIGGGLCQIGTTVFRAIMNSGLPVTERRNHSLVVSYYNDPANGLPGTDATIYDPAPDLKFINDTGNYLLLDTLVLPDQSLKFSFYGTSDGRKGSYSAPVVSKWTPVPKDAETKYLESDSVKTGEQRCKAGFPGAVASFTYTVEKADGAKEDKVFTSVYRMLPPVCLVAKGELPKAEPDTTEAPLPADAIPVPASDAIAQ